MKIRDQEAIRTHPKLSCHVTTIEPEFNLSFGIMPYPAARSMRQVERERDVDDKSPLLTGRKSHLGNGGIINVGTREKKRTEGNG